MANNLKELLNKPLPKDDKNRSSLFAVISAYLLYMAWEVLRDTANGVSSMSVEASVACAAFLALGGLGTLIASMASVISYKLFVAEHPYQAGTYLRTFLYYNFAGLVLLGALTYVLVL